MEATVVSCLGASISPVSNATSRLAGLAQQQQIADVKFNSGRIKILLTMPQIESFTHGSSTVQAPDPPTRLESRPHTQDSDKCYGLPTPHSVCTPGSGPAQGLR